MEVGAVKQAFNNEVILLKKNLNQAKTQIIHKLTRKAKTLAEKKCPDAMKEKLKRKAESAVKEVLIIKKIKPRDIAKFIVTHKNELKEYLNKPTVDNDKACARLLLHKALTSKYDLIRSRFGNVSIKDLFMSRQERLQLKKEAKEKLQNKKKKRKSSETDNTGGIWDVEPSIAKNSKNSLDAHFDNSEDDVDASMEESNNITKKRKNNLDEDSDRDYSEENESDESTDEPNKIKTKNVGHELDSDNSEENEVDESMHEEKNNKRNLNEDSDGDHSDENEVDDSMGEEHSGNESDIEPIKVSKEKAKRKLIKSDGKVNAKSKFKNFKDLLSKNESNSEEEDISDKESPKKLQINSKNKVDKVKNANAEKRLKDKNKNLNEKLKKRQFNKDSKDTTVKERPMVDPFFITSTGENYMSLVEPRPPDEVKDEHRKGNRKFRRAIMFGHDFKPRNDFKSSKYQQNQQNGRRNDFKNDRNNYKGNKSDFKSNRKYQDDKTKDFNGFAKKHGFDRKNDVKSAPPEKLHPSWEAKKKQSSIVPFKGKKIMFGED